MNVKIVVLDGYTLNPGDLNWDGLDRLGECVVHARTPPDLTLARACGAPLVLTNKTVMDRAVLSRLPDLKYVGVLATGYNVVDVACARERGIPVTNIPEYGTASVTQMVFALLMELTHHAGLHSDSVRDGEWTRSIDFCYWKTPLVELHDLTMGIVGFGRIGRSVAQVATAFGMHVLAFDQYPQEQVPAGVRMADLDTLFATSDVVTLHCPLTPETKGLVNTARLARMKQTAFLVNTSRGPVVNEADLARALNEGCIAGAGLDVLEQEPPPAGNTLLKAKNCIITPHIAWATRAARARLMQTAVDNVAAFLAGRPQNVVNA